MAQIQPLLLLIYTSRSGFRARKDTAALFNFNFYNMYKISQNILHYFSLRISAAEDFDNTIDTKPINIVIKYVITNIVHDKLLGPAS